MRRLSTEPVSEEVAQIGREIRRQLGIETKTGVRLAPLTTMRVGGPADVYAEVHSPFELRGLIRFAAKNGFPYFVLGGGSNLVVSDRGIRGIVIRNLAEEHWLDGNILHADSGLKMAKAATFSQNKGLSGLEFGLAIPGTVGGAVWANAGAHDSDISRPIVEAGVVSSDGKEHTVPREALALGYRDSALKRDHPDAPATVLWATFELLPADPDQISLRLDEIRKWRQQKQPLGWPSAGSVFRNPEVGKTAGELIDDAGLKGRRVGGAVVSEKHANFIVNDQAGSAADVRRLAEEVRRTVHRERGVELVFEIVFAGDWSDWESAA